MDGQLRPWHSWGIVARVGGGTSTACTSAIAGAMSRRNRSHSAHALQLNTSLYHALSWFRLAMSTSQLEWTAQPRPDVHILVQASSRAHWLSQEEASGRLRLAPLASVWAAFNRAAFSMRTARSEDAPGSPQAETPDKPGPSRLLAVTQLESEPRVAHPACSRPAGLLEPGYAEGPERLSPEGAVQ